MEIAFETVTVASNGNRWCHFTQPCFDASPNQDTACQDRRRPRALKPLLHPALVCYRLRTAVSTFLLVTSLKTTLHDTNLEQRRSFRCHRGSPVVGKALKGDFKRSMSWLPCDSRKVALQCPVQLSPLSSKHVCWLAAMSQAPEVTTIVTCPLNSQAAASFTSIWVLIYSSPVCKLKGRGEETISATASPINIHFPISPSPTQGIIGNLAVAPTSP